VTPQALKIHCPTRAQAQPSILGNDKGMFATSPQGAGAGQEVNREGMVLWRVESQENPGFALTDIGSSARSYDLVGQACVAFPGARASPRDV
jgi:hypothetical protein